MSACATCVALGRWRVMDSVTGQGTNFGSPSWACGSQAFGLWVWAELIGLGYVLVLVGFGIWPWAEALGRGHVARLWAVYVVGLSASLPRVYKLVVTPVGWARHESEPSGLHLLHPTRTIFDEIFLSPSKTNLRRSNLHFSPPMTTCLIFPSPYCWTLS